MVKKVSIDEEVAVFLASLNPAKMLAFKPSQELQARLDFLFDKQKTAGLTFDEERELKNFLVINNIVRLAKAHAFQMLNT